MKILDKIAEVFIAIGNDMKNRLVASPPTAAGQVLVSKDVEGQVVAVWDDVEMLEEMINASKLFTELVNCTFKRGVLSVIDINHPEYGNQAFAVLYNPRDLEIKNFGYATFCIGDSPNALDYLSGNTQGIVINMKDNSYAFADTTEYSLIENFSCAKTDTLNIIFDRANYEIRLENKTNNQSWVLPPHPALYTPKYFIIFFDYYDYRQDYIAVKTI